MPSYSSDALPLFEKWKEARAAETAAVTALHQAMARMNASGMQDVEELAALTAAMEQTHAAAMSIYDDLQAFRRKAD